jgi:D-alanine-D-alanine ligase
MRERVILLQGGFSEEREISLSSSAAIYQALIELNYETIILDPADFSSYLQLGDKIVSLNPHIVFIGLHGGDGENGSVQALLSLLNIPYTGSDMRSSALCMDKEVSFAFASSFGVKVPEYEMISERMKYNRDAIVKILNIPLVVKPNFSGSSVGITIVRDPSELDSAIESAFEYSNRIIVQRYIAGSELTVSLLGSSPLPVVEIKVKEGWYDYRNKYTKGNTFYEVPALLTAEDTREIQELSLTVFRKFGCRAYARVDFRYDGKDFYFLEVNTLPGMTSLSLTPMAAREAGISFPQLIDRIIQESL